jgi:hypothetical protein
MSAKPRSKHGTTLQLILPYTFGPACSGDLYFRLCPLQILPLVSPNQRKADCYSAHSFAEVEQKCRLYLELL